MYIESTFTKKVIEEIKQHIKTNLIDIVEVTPHYIYILSTLINTPLNLEERIYISDHTEELIKKKIEGKDASP